MTVYVDALFPTSPWLSGARQTFSLVQVWHSASHKTRGQERARRNDEEARQPYPAGNTP